MFWEGHWLCILNMLSLDQFTLPGDQTTKINIEIMYKLSANVIHTNITGGRGGRVILTKGHPLRKGAVETVGGRG